MITFKTLKYKDLSEKFGDPGTDEGLFRIKQSLVTKKLPFTFYNEDRKTGKLIPVNYVRIHGYIADAYIDGLEEILEHYGPEEIERLTLNREHGGGFCHRPIRDGKDWSVHAWGAAVDQWCHMGKMGQVPKTPEFCVLVFKKRGFVWGGYFPGKYIDGMHWSVCFG
jgi:hypothetical protein